MVGERMTGADAAWLHMDRPTNRMVVNIVCWFAQTPDWDAVRDALRWRWVQEYPRFRQKVREPAFSWALVAVPEWVDDASFCFEDHLRQVILDQPGDEAALHEYVESHIADPLQPDRPLWEVHLIDGYQGGSALLLRVSHALGDGTALMHALIALSDDEPGRDQQGSTALVAGPVDGASAPSGAQAVRDSASDWVTTFPKLALGELGHAEAIAARVGSLSKLAVVRQDRRTVLRERLGTRKRVTWTVPVSLASVRSVAQQGGATVNDVLLAVTAAALGRYLRQHGSDVDEIGAMLPFNLRPLHVPMARSLGNKFGLVYPDLPVAPMEMPARIARVHEVMTRIKLAKQANVVFGWISSVGLMPMQVENVLIDRYAGMSSVIITNVPGPRRPISIAGSPVAGLLFWVPTSGPVGVGLSFISYAGQVTIGLMVDALLVPDVARMRELLEDELAGVTADPLRGSAPGATGAHRPETPTGPSARDEYQA